MDWLRSPAIDKQKIAPQRTIAELNRQQKIAQVRRRRTPELKLPECKPGWRRSLLPFL